MSDTNGYLVRQATRDWNRLGLAQQPSHLDLRHASHITRTAPICIPQLFCTKEIPIDLEPNKRRLFMLPAVSSSKTTPLGAGSSSSSLPSPANSQVPSPPPSPEPPRRPRTPPPVKLQKTVSFDPGLEQGRNRLEMATQSRPCSSGIAPDDTTAITDEHTAIASSFSNQSTRNYSAFSPSPASCAAVHEGDDEHEHHEGFFGKLGAIELENKGSVARDHLALERTFLAWLRTSLAFASIGIAITQLFRLSSANAQLKPTVETLGRVGKPLGATFLAVAIVVLITGTNRYYESQMWLLQGKFPASRGSVFLLTIMSCALITASMVVVLAVGVNQKET
ncbi:hypothetical protein BDD12DRAFT_811661 [Trichophaea hybrida]|nr:hypothetical protein BDD12DRAFT_811661 [Trichophaea hybrida]